jgi:protein gp37
VSDIEWTDATWNPIVGCSRVSPGCEHCYAERFVHRGLAEQHRGLTVIGKKGPRWTGEARLVESRLGEPLSWRKPKRVFVNSLSDLWHEAVSNETVARIFGVMAACPHLTFQVLTKRPKRMREWFSWIAAEGEEVLAAVGEKPDGNDGQIAAACAMYVKEKDCGGLLTRAQFTCAVQQSWPLANVWLGVTAEDQQRADERIPMLLDTPAALRFVSYEPGIGPVRFDRIGDDEMGATYDALRGCMSGDHEHSGGPRLDWLIVGGESAQGGAEARGLELDWAYSTIEQCRGYRVPVFMKQLGSRAGSSGFNYKTADRAGANPSEWPADLRVREFPTLTP